MFKFKAMVIDKDTKKHTIIESEYPNKSAFIKDLRNNGYKVNPDKVKKSEIFDYITNNTNCNIWDWKENN